MNKTKNDFIYGIDEVGRGAFAGPLVAASVYVTEAQKAKLKRKKLVIRDSKTLSELQRETVYEEILDLGVIFSLQQVDIEDINQHGIGWANTTAIRALMEKNKGPTQSDGVGPLTLHYVVDGRFPMRQIEVKGIDVQCIVDADATIFPVILAGIVAKVTRDRMMKKLHSEFEVYKWNENKGYGTKYHLEAIRLHGISPHHRIAFLQTAFATQFSQLRTVLHSS